MMEIKIVLSASYLHKRERERERAVPLRCGRYLISETYHFFAGYVSWELPAVLLNHCFCSFY